MPIFLQPQGQITSNKVDKLTRETTVYILGLQQRDKASMLAVNSKEFFTRKKWGLVPKGEQCFCSLPQHGRRNVMRKPANVMTLKLTL